MLDTDTIFDRLIDTGGLLALGVLGGFVGDLGLIIGGFVGDLGLGLIIGGFVGVGVWPVLCIFGDELLGILGFDEAEANGHIRAFFWSVDVKEGGDESPITCSSDGTPVRYPSGTTTPEELTPSDLVLLEMTSESNVGIKTRVLAEKLHGGVRTLVNAPPSQRIERVLATALLANEEAGAIRLEMVKEKVVKKEAFFLFFPTSKTETIHCFIQAVVLGHAPSGLSAALNPSYANTAPCRTSSTTGLAKRCLNLEGPQ